MLNLVITNKIIVKLGYAFLLDYYFFEHTSRCMNQEKSNSSKISLANSQKVVYSGIKSGGKWWKVSRSGKMEGIKLRKPHTIDGSW